MNLDELTPKIGKHITHVSVHPVSYTSSDGWQYTTERRDVILLAAVKGYAMVRRPGCMPYVVTLKELE